MDFQALKSQAIEYSLDQKRALVIGSVSALCVALFLLLISRGEAVEKPQVRVVEQQIATTLLVHVAGEVKKPGVYPLISGSIAISWSGNQDKPVFSSRRLGKEWWKISWQ